MFLRTITIRGFKSFADKTVLEFVPGVSVIVGPNGSGKSNLVDAISWALGEQGPRALRGGQMADVIFAGTPSRPALGMAEVKLVIDNAAGKIAVPMSEIEISRTIFVSGESEYRIGGQVVRLMDVQELLSETGIGRALHTVVGQGQLEEVLLSRPEDRRKYIEEAAGVAKHRRRKERAERKLEGLDQDLLRLSDVLAELRRQLKPLRQQADMAKKHETLTAQADELARAVAAARLRALQHERERRKGGWDQGLQERTGARAALDALDGDVLAAADARAVAARSLADAEHVFRAAGVERERADQTFRAAVDREGAARQDLSAEAGRAVRMDAAIEEIARVQAQVAAVVAELEAREQEMVAAEEAFRRADDHRHEVEDLRRRLGEDAAARRGEVQSLEAALGAGVKEGDRLRDRFASVTERLDSVRAERDGLEADVEQMDGQIAPLVQKRSHLEDERRRLVEKLEEHEDARRAMQARKDLLDARRRDIEETPGSRFLRSHQGRAMGLLDSLVHAEAGLERALGAALGPIADAVVYEEAAAALQDAGTGDGAILAISAGGPVPLGLQGERKLLSAVQADPAARGIVSQVLKDVYLASSLEEAVRKQGEHPHASFVTPDGVLIGPAVIHTAKETDVRLREIGDELKMLAHDLSAVQQQARPRRERLEQISGETEFLGGQVEAADAEIAAAVDAMTTLDRDLVGLAKEQELLGQRVSAIEEAVLVARERLTALGTVHTGDLPDLPPFPHPPIQARVAVETLRQTRHQHDQRLGHLRAERDALAARDPARPREEFASAEASRVAAEAAAAAADVAFHGANEARELAAQAEREAAEREAAANKSWRDASHLLDELRERYEEDDRSRGDIERRISEAERLLSEGFGVDPAAAVAGLDEDDSTDVLEKKQDLVQRRLALLGRVNLLASGEFEALQERHDFMQRELDDVRRARRDLLEVIAQVDREIAETFTTAYRDVAMQFEELIKELFPGGEGRLVLTDPANPLESGIEIEASPGRKRVKRISLLSGGERSLTALAFLFAIFTARPSPFYLMDEVEPALDDLNLHRFLRLVAGFAGDAQVLIVTHQKRTMEIADMMYGISLNADGTTKVIAQRLDDRESAGDAARIEAQREAAAEAFAAQTSAQDETIVDLPDGQPVG